MSYILDAIKKTDADKNGGDVPNLSSEHQVAPFIEEDDSRRWLLPLLAVIAVMLGVIIWLLLKPANPQLTASNELAADTVSEPVKEQPVVSQQPPSNRLPVESKPEQESVASGSGLMIEKAPLQVKSPVVEKVTQRPVKEVVTPQPVAPTTTPSEPVRQQPKISEQPVHLAAINHDDWPTLIYTTHIYATDPNDRFVMLNGKAYSIGDTINADLKVIDILENDLLVSYRGQQVIVPGLTDVNP